MWAQALGLVKAYVPYIAAPFVAYHTLGTENENEFSNTFESTKNYFNAQLIIFLISVSLFCFGINIVSQFRSFHSFLFGIAAMIVGVNIFRFREHVIEYTSTVLYWVDITVAFLGCAFVLWGLRYLWITFWFTFKFYEGKGDKECVVIIRCIEFGFFYPIRVETMRRPSDGERQLFSNKNNNDETVTLDNGNGEIFLTKRRRLVMVKRVYQFGELEPLQLQCFLDRCYDFWLFFWM